MKQQASFLQWASIMLDVDVSSLSSIQDVRFVKNLLWHVEETYFTNWQNGRGGQSYSQVLGVIAKYFCEEIGTDITQQIEEINVYKNVIEVWQLVLCIAIKGNKRGPNINIIFQMDYDYQSELVGIVSNIINKFGQNVATDKTDEQLDVTVTEEKDMDGRERKMMIEFAEENEELKQKIKELESQLKREKKMATTQRQELQHSLQMMRLEKMAFFQIIANANRSSSRIFEDGDDPLLSSQVSLSQLANDIVVFIRDQRKRLAQELEKTSILQEELHVSKRDIRRTVDQNEMYLMQLGNMSAYERELEGLRLEKNQIFQENSLLLENIATLQEQKFQLLANFQKRMQNLQADDGGEANEETGSIRVSNNNRLARRESKVSKELAAKREQVRKSQLSDDSEIKISINNVERQDEVRGTCLGKEMDQIREPQLRNKLQREIVYLKTTIAGLQRQNESLKKANQALQRSTRQFVDSNQQVVKKWEEDYQGLLDKMTELTKFREQLQHKQEDKEQIQVDITELEGSKKSEEAQPNLVIQQEPALDESKKSQSSELEKLKLKRAAEKVIEQDRVALWDEIVKKLKQIVKKGKAKELAYENSLNNLRQQNFKLLEIIRKKNKEQDISSSRVEQYDSSQSRKNNQLEKSKSVSSQEHLALEKQKLMAASRAPQKMVFLSMVEGEDDGDVSFFRHRDKSSFQMNSIVMEGSAIQRKVEPNSSVNPNEEYYLNVNRKLTFSILQTLEGLGGRGGEHDVMGSIDLQQKLQKEITKIQLQYQRLNENYQSVFNKLNIYTEQLKQKESLKQEYVQMLAELTKAEEEVKIGHQSEIIRLRIINDNLHRNLIQTVTEKDQILEVINRLGASLAQGQAKKQDNWQGVLQQVSSSLKQAQLKYSESLKDPLNFLDVCLSGSSAQGNLQKFYRLYMKEREKTAHLNEQLELLSCVLLEYRTMCS